MTQPGIPPYHYPPPQPPRPRSTMRRLLPLWITLGLVFVGLLVGAVAFGRAVGHEVKKSGQYPGDVRIDSCAANSLGNVTATITVTNRTDRAASYAVQIGFTAADGAQLTTGLGFVTRLSPGLAARDEVLGYTPQAAGVQIGCRVVSAQRTVLP